MEIKNNTSSTSKSTSKQSRAVISSSDKSGISRRIPFSVVESYKSVRTNITFLLGKSNHHVIAVSSPNAGEGKSTTAINVAIAFAQLDSKVLVIDSDMRRSSVHKKLKIENKVGLSDVVAGLAEFDDAVIHYNDNLDILTGGAVPPNPSELLSSAAFGELLERIKVRYDYVIIDTPPINVVSDAILIAPKTDGVVLVIRAGFTPYDSVEHALSSAKFANVNILGVVLNGSDIQNHYYKYKRYRGYKYYSYYGYKKRGSAYRSGYYK